jgi:hypothetical protein
MTTYRGKLATKGTKVTKATKFVPSLSSAPRRRVAALRRRPTAITSACSRFDAFVIAVGRRRREAGMAGRRVAFASCASCVLRVLVVS